MMSSSSSLLLRPVPFLVLPFLLLLLSSVPPFFLPPFLAAAASAATRSLHVANDMSGSSLEIYWVNSNNGDTVLISDPNMPVTPGSSMGLSSYAGHQFQVRESASERTGYCGGGGNEMTCQIGYFTVNENDDQGE